MPIIVYFDLQILAAVISGSNRSRADASTSLSPFASGILLNIFFKFAEINLLHNEMKIHYMIYCEFMKLPSDSAN